MGIFGLNIHKDNFMATYKFYYSTSIISSLEEVYNSSVNIMKVRQEFKSVKGDVDTITRIDILADPDLINTDEALGFNR
jgi:hypothetical protein